MGLFGPYNFKEAPMRRTAVQRTPFGFLLPPTSKLAAYVNSNGPGQDGQETYFDELTVTTLNAGLNAARSGKGDVVLVAPDHAENISTADQMSNLVAGTTILGLGAGNLRPTFTWTAAAATFLFDQDNTWLENCILKMASSGNSGVTVAAPITVSADGCGISNCRIMFGDDADDNVTIGVTVSAADDFTFANNRCYGATAAECTTFMRITDCERPHLYDNIIVGATSSTTVGVLQFLSTLSTDVLSERNTYQNNKALSVHCVTGMAGVTGLSRFDQFVILDTATLAGWVTPASVQFHRPTISNTAGETGSETVGTVSA